MQSLARFVLFGVFIQLLVFPSSIQGAVVNVSKAVFVTDERSVPPGEISEALTVQLQNSGGTVEQTDETADLTFISSSASGEFLGATGNPVTTTMSKNTASRTFYYRDSTEGSHTITVTIRTRDSGNMWTATQKIKVGEGLEQSENNDKDNESSSESNTGGSQSSSKKLSTYTKSKSLKIGAGRERLVSVNSKVEFEVESNQDLGNVPKRDIVWSFGDGGEQKGKRVAHEYLYPGEYHVVLNIEYGGERYVARTKVDVIEPVVSITKVIPGKTGYLEIRNDTNTEINLSNWRLEQGKSWHALPKDLIIGGKSSLKIPAQVLGVELGGDLNLKYSNGNLAFEFKEKPAIVFNAIPTPVKKVTTNTPMLVVPKEKVLAIATTTIEEKLSIESASVSETPSARGFWGFVKALFTVH